MNIKHATEFLKQGKLVAFPTETVYGLGGNALSDIAVAAIYEAKGRPTFNPLIIHVRSIENAKTHVVFNEHAQKLAEHFWPGPLTLVLPRTSDCRISLLASAGLDTIAIRMPAHPIAQTLLNEVNIPLAAPSANRSGKISPTLAQHVAEEFGDRVAMILDGGACAVGIESTVIDLSTDSPTILRPGSITREQIENVIGKVQIADQNSVIKSPGMMERHYAPSKPLRLNVETINPGEALLAFGPALPGASIVKNLSERGDLQEAAANLFKMLRELDASNAKSIAVMLVPEKDLGIAINDRLKRAAT